VALMNGREAFDRHNKINEAPNGRPLSPTDIHRQLVWSAKHTLATRLSPIIVLVMGRECYAAVRRSKRRTPQIRVWSKSSGNWRVWRSPVPSEIVRYATKMDEDAFQPDYGLKWEEGR
jgi:hypothetical protein